jgi:hypothetical protein
MDAFLGETDARGRMPSYGKVALAVVVGKGRRPPHGSRAVSGAHRGRLHHSGRGVTYWVGEAMGEKEYKDFEKAPKDIAAWTPMLASNAAHLAHLLKEKNYPGIEGGR